MDPNTQNPVSPVNPIVDPIGTTVADPNVALNATPTAFNAVPDPVAPVVPEPIVPVAPEPQVPVATPVIETPVVSPIGEQPTTPVI
jgi:hypothetical protein